MQDFMMESTVLLIIVSGFSGAFGLLIKIFLDYLKSGRMEKASIYVTKSVCQQVRENCEIRYLKDHLYSVRTGLEKFKVETRSHSKETDKRLSENNSDIRAMRKDITDIKGAQMHSTTLLETIAESLKNN